MALILLIVSLLRLPTFFRTVLDWDESLYILMAGQWLAGHLPYTTIWDNKPVGIYAIFALCKLVFRGPVLAMRAATVLVVSLSALGLWRLAPHFLPEAPRIFRRRLAAVVAAAFILGSLSNDGLSANTEMFMECFSLYAVLAAIAPGFCAGAPWRRGFAVGLLFGLACMTKYVAVFEAPAIALALLFFRNESFSWSGGVKKCLAAAGGALLPPLLVLLLYAVTGHLALWWQCSITANIVRVSAAVQASQLRQVVLVILPRWLPSVTAACILLAGAPRVFIRSVRRLETAAPRPRVLLLLWLAGGALGVASAKSFYDHYFLQILPPLCLTFVWVLGRPALRLSSWPGRYFAALAAALLAIPAYAGATALAAISQPFAAAVLPSMFTNTDTPSRIAASLRPAIAAGATLYVFDSQPIIYALTGASPPTRYVFPSVLTKDALEKVAGIDAAREVAKILAQKPGFIICNAGKPGPGADEAVYDEIKISLASHYNVLDQYPEATVYQLKADGRK